MYPASLSTLHILTNEEILRESLQSVGSVGDRCWSDSKQSLSTFQAQYTSWYLSFKWCKWSSVIASSKEEVFGLKICSKYVWVIWLIFIFRNGFRSSVLCSSFVSFFLTWYFLFGSCYIEQKCQRKLFPCFQCNVCILKITSCIENGMFFFPYELPTADCT